MRRAYRRDKYLAILDSVRRPSRTRRSRPTSSSGSPARPRRTSRDTLDLVRQARFASAFTFQYSIRAGTPAATMPDQVPHEVVQERYDRLVAAAGGDLRAGEREARRDTVEVLVAEGEGRKDSATRRMSGRARDNRLVHFAPHAPTAAAEPRARATS